jgi:hypothetical protein
MYVHDNGIRGLFFPKVPYPKIIKSDKELHTMVPNARSTLHENTFSLSSINAPETPHAT